MMDGLVNVNATGDKLFLYCPLKKKEKEAKTTLPLKAEFNWATHLVGSYDFIEL